MIEWDRILMKELKKLNIEPMVYTRFKDDIEVVMESIEKGTKWEEGKLVNDDDKVLEDENKSDSKVTIGVIQQIANNINPMIQLTTETPCNSENGMLAILDVQARINKEEANRIDFEFFEKPTKNSMVILADSALNSSSKRTILTQECLRRLRNTKVELGEKVQMKYLNEFMIKLKNSGYGQKYRMEIVDSAMKAFEKMIEDDKNNIKPLYRSKNWNIVERKQLKENNKQNWWRKGQNKDFKTVCFVPPTPGGILTKELRKRENELNKFSTERIKFVEGGGIKVKNILTTKNLSQNLECSQPWCPVCKERKDVEGNQKHISCSTNNIGYRWTCTTCSERTISKLYEGALFFSLSLSAGLHFSQKGLS